MDHWFERHTKKLRLAVATPWLLLIGFWLILSLHRSGPMKVKTALWLLNAPISLATETPYSLLVATLILVVVSLFVFSIIKRSEFLLLAAIFVLGSSMLVSACIYWVLFAAAMGT